MRTVLSLILILAAFRAHADCDVAPLKKEIVLQYAAVLPVKNEKGELGHARGRNFVVSDYLMRVKNESFLIANFDLRIRWLRGHDQTVKTLVVATVDPATCRIEGYEGGDTLGTSMSRN
jgi:hypothetical protein